MLQFEELMLTLRNLKPDMDDLKEALGYDKLSSEVAELEQKAAAPDFWDDMENSQKILKRTASLKGKLAAFDAIANKYDDTMTLIELGDEEEELELLEEAQTFKVKTIDYLDGDEAGLKSASILIEGNNAYGYLKCEMGVHRLVRISPFDSSGRRHTSFASLEVMPEIDDDVDVEIRPEDLHIDTYRSSGAGGQHINKTDSAVRITHIPTGIVCACQNERSQVQNKAMAMKMLKSKLMEIKERENLEKIEDIKGVQKEIAWGSQIRSYVFMPYTLAKDHRTGYEMGNINAVMDGDIDGFINAYLKAQSLNALGNFE